MSDFWQDRPTFVTGGTGLLGGWLVKELVNLGAHVVCLVRDGVPRAELYSSGVDKQVTIIQGDLMNKDCLERIVAEYEIDTVIHLAAQTIVGTAKQNPVGTFDANIRGTWNLLEACRVTGVGVVKQIVVASSDKAYGDHEILPYREDVALKGRHPYDVSKSCTDLISHTYAHTYGLPVVITRCGNFYGGGDLNWNRIVPGTIRSLLNGQRPVIRSDGRFIRDYLYVEDGASAYIKLAEGLAADRGLIGEAFNFSNETQVSVLDIVYKIQKLIGSTFELDIRNEASNEIHSQYLDASKARKMLEWSPSFDLDSGLTKTIEWYERYLEGKLN